MIAIRDNLTGKIFTRQAFINTIVNSITPRIVYREKIKDTKWSGWIEAEYKLVEAKWKEIDHSMLRILRKEREVNES